MLLDGEVVSRVLHVWLSAVVVTGAAVMIVGGRLKIAPDEQGSRDALVRRGARLSLIGTALQIPAGIWLALEMPETVRNPLLGADWLASGLFIVSLLLTMQLLHTLGAAAWGSFRAAGDSPREPVGRAVGVDDGRRAMRVQLLTTAPIEPQAARLQSAPKLGDASTALASDW